MASMAGNAGDEGGDGVLENSDSGEEGGEHESRDDPRLDTRAGDVAGDAIVTPMSTSCVGVTCEKTRARRKIPKC